MSERSRSPVGRNGHGSIKVVHVGVLGLGTVGSGTVQLLLEQRALIRERTNMDLIVKKAADLNIDRKWDFEMPASILTKDAMEIIDDPEIKIVVELIGGKGIAKKLITDSINAGKSVVTANKALLADHGIELFNLAATKGVDLFYEASVAGGIPIIKALREGLVANPVKSILGIMNGTCNYILTRMEREGVAFETVLSEAQKLGYAEAEPSLDVDGWDTAHKAVILARLAFGGSYSVDHAKVKGIRGIAGQDIKYAAEFGYRIKLLAILKQAADGTAEISVEPTLIPADHLLSKVDMSFNAVFVHGNVVGETMYYGRGAGSLPTASAVVADIADVARNSVLLPQCRAHHRDRNPLRAQLKPPQVKPYADHLTRAYIRLEVKDFTGSLAKVIAVLAQHNISILAVTDFLRGQPLPGSSVPKDGLAPVVLLTGDARVADVDAALAQCLKLPEVGPDHARFRLEALGSV
eukprot:TRINITY_DN61742_c0_g1_i1.p1 TRINITY_DN61742_c0_g1~~TRINITY_DN61742_c0_g1_i1.p1  ORF type:complete len:466 (-),score=81.41 TRINITY_DN61742_c0_g1_i1:360-1757(-)